MVELKDYYTVNDGVNDSKLNLKNNAKVMK
jgi:hypothetical protein